MAGETTDRQAPSVAPRAVPALTSPPTGVAFTGAHGAAPIVDRNRGSNMPGRFCDACGSPVEHGAAFCETCGSQLAPGLLQRRLVIVLIVAIAVVVVSVVAVLAGRGCTSSASADGGDAGVTHDESGDGDSPDGASEVGWAGPAQVPAPGDRRAERHLRAPMESSNNVNRAEVPHQVARRNDDALARSVDHDPGSPRQLNEGTKVGTCSGARDAGGSTRLAGFTKPTAQEVRG